MHGTVVSIHIAETNGGPLRPLDTAELVWGAGIRGDRHFREDGGNADSAISLVESEQVEMFNELTGLSIAPHDTRRQVVTTGVPLNDLVGVRFRIGEVQLQGVELCEPCSHLAALLREQHQITDVSATDIIRGLMHRAGLRARILTDGEIRVGDQVEYADR